MSFQPILKKCRISKSLIALCFIPKHSQLFKLSRCREEDHFGKYLHYSYIPNCVIQNNGVFFDRGHKTWYTFDNTDTKIR